MVTDVVVTAAKEDGNTATSLAAVVDNVLGQGLNQVSSDSAGALKEEADAASSHVPLAGNVLAVLVGAAGIDVAVDSTDNVLQAKGEVVAKVVAIAVDSGGLNGNSSDQSNDQRCEVHANSEC